MSGTDELDAKGLRDALVTHLEHLQSFKGVRYVPGGRLPLPVRDVNTTSHVEAGAQSQSPSKLSQQVRQQASEWSNAQKLAYLRDKVVGDCQRCPLSRSRTKLVFGVGNPEARLVIVGEAPGRDEDQQGEPFVGLAGQRLNAWLEHFGLQRDEIYIANVLKCRPPDNRDPAAREVQTCAPFLHAQLRAIGPRAIVCLGRFAGNVLLRQQARMYEMRGQLHRYRDAKHKIDIPVVVTYHPSYVLRREREAQQGQTNPDNDRKSEDQKVLSDLSKAVELLRA